MLAIGGHYILSKAENRYSGIPTMRREMKNLGLPEPVFENRRNEFVVIFFNQNAPTTSSSLLNEETSSLLNFCKEPKSREELTDFMNIDTFSYLLKRYLQPLLDAGLLELTIPDKPRSRSQRYRTVSKQ